MTDALVTMDVAEAASVVLEAVVPLAVVVAAVPPLPQPAMRAIVVMLISRSAERRSSAGHQSWSWWSSSWS